MEIRPARASFQNKAVGVFDPWSNAGFIPVTGGIFNPALLDRKFL
jgi:hypothetical protein